MKSIAKRLTTAAVALFAVAVSLPETRAANVTLDGYGSYGIKGKESYYPKAPTQSGRYNSLGRDYYHKATYKMDFVTNNSKAGSGSLSFELWAMPYYGATSGTVLMTRGLDPLVGGAFAKKVTRQGLAVSLGKKKVPELNLFEYTNKGWKSRDHLTFTGKAFL